MQKPKPKSYPGGDENDETVPKVNGTVKHEQMSDDDQAPQSEVPNGTNNNEINNETKIEQSDTKQEV